jgi:hypothetical protein
MCGFTVGGEGNDPSVLGRSGIQVDLDWGDLAVDVAEKIAIALGGVGGGDEFSTSFEESIPAAFAKVVVENVSGGGVNEAEIGTMSGDFAVARDVEGSDSAIESGDFFLIYTVRDGYYVWFNVDGAGGDPLVADHTGIEVALSTNSTADEVAAAIDAALGAVLGGQEFSTSLAGNQITVTNVLKGAVAAGADWNVGGAFSVARSTAGVDSGVMGGDYFLISSAEDDYYVWFTLEGVGTDPSGEPATAGRTGIRVDLLESDDAAAVATKIAAALGGVGEFDITTLGAVLTVTNLSTGEADDAGVGTVGGSFAVSALRQGASSAIESGDYFTIDTVRDGYYVWFNVDGAGGDPLVAGRTGIEVAISTNSTADEVAAAIDAALGCSIGRAGI